MAVTVLTLILQAYFLKRVTSDDVINFSLLSIIFLNLFILTKFYLSQVNFFSLTGKFCQMVYIKVFINHSQLKQWFHEFLLLESFLNKFF